MGSVAVLSVVAVDRFVAVATLWCAPLLVAHRCSRIVR